MKTTKKIKNKEVAILSNASVYEFPKYATMLINLANGIAQATRPNVVGQMSELIQEFGGNSLDQWIEWYSQQKPDAIKNATNKIMEVLPRIKDSLDHINSQMVENWVKDLVFNKTFCGLKVQQAIIVFIAKSLSKGWRLSNKEEEAKGIDGFIGDKPVQVKADTYKQKANLSEIIPVPIVYYKKGKDGLLIEYNSEDFS